jgi:hypothetical protein
MKLQRGGGGRHGVRRDVCAATALTHAETHLIAHDHDDAVRDQRHAFELALAPTMSAAVERATGRTVSSFRTSTDLEPMLTLLIFILTPAAATPPEQ